MNKEYKNWIAKLKYIETEYPFGKLQQFTNEKGRLHRDNGPAYISPTRCIHYINGQQHGADVDIFGTMNFYFRGILVPRHYILAPETITVKEILANKNTEVRYAGMLIYGYERMIQEKHITLIHEENERQLYRADKILPVPFKIVRVLNSTPELDGTYKPYYLTVPDSIKNCKEAVAWTFGFEEHQYQPTQET